MKEKQKKPSFWYSIKNMPEIAIELVKKEISEAKADVKQKLFRATSGIVLIAIAAVAILIALPVGVAAAISALELVFVSWLAHLLMFGLLLLVGFILILLGVNKLKTGLPPLPDVDSEKVQKDFKKLQNKRLEN